MQSTCFIPPQFLQYYADLATPQLILDYSFLTVQAAKKMSFLFLLLVIAFI